MTQQFFVPALIALSASLALLAVLCLRGYLALKKQVFELAMDSANVASAPEKIAEFSKQLEGLHSRLDKNIASVSGKVTEEISKQLEGLHSRLDELEETRSPLNELEKRKNVPPEAPVAPPPAPVNLNRRSQVMHLHRSGESTASIASAFGVSQGEIELMVKVQELLSDRAGGEISPEFL